MEKNTVDMEMFTETWKKLKQIGILWQRWLNFVE